MNNWSKAERHAERAHQYYQNGQMEKALSELKKALSFNPEQGDWHFGLGLTLDALHRYAEAATSFEQALRLRGDDVETMLYLAVNLIRAGESGRAVEILAKAQKLEPENESTFCYRIAAYAQMNDHEQAELMFYRARQISDHCPVCYDHMAQSLWMRGELDRAGWCWRQTLKLDPKFPGVHANLARLQWRRGEHEAAKEEYLLELREDPSDLQSLLELGRLLVEMEKLSEAAEKFRRILEIDPTHGAARMHLGELALAGGHVDAAEAEFKKAARRQSDLPGLYLRMAQVAMRRGQTSVARRHVKRELEQTTDHHPAHALELAGVLADLKMTREAKQLLTGQLEKAGEREYSPQLHAMLWIYRGVAQLMDGKTQAGILDCRRGLRLWPENGLALHNLTLAYAKLGRFGKAREMLKRAIKVEPGNRTFRRLRWKLYWLQAKHPFVYVWQRMGMGLDKQKRKWFMRWWG